MAEASLAPPFGLTGMRRVLAIAAAAILITSFFVVLGFPYDRITPRIEQGIRTVTFGRVYGFAGELRATASAAGRLPSAMSSRHPSDAPFFAAS